MKTGRESIDRARAPATRPVRRQVRPRRSRPLTNSEGRAISSPERGKRHFVPGRGDRRSTPPPPAPVCPCLVSYRPKQTNVQAGQKRKNRVATFSLLLDRWIHRRKETSNCACCRSAWSFICSQDFACRRLTFGGYKSSYGRHSIWRSKCHI